MGRASKGGSADGDAVAAAHRTRVLAAGANLCWIGSAWPMLARGGVVAQDVAGLSALLVLLVGGVLALGRRAELAAAALLVALPATLAFTLAARPAGSTERAFGALATGVLLLSLALYGALAAQATAARALPLSVRCSPIGEPRVRAPKPGRRLADAILALSLLGAVALSAVAPLWGGAAALRTAWGEAAPEAGVLTALVGSALAVAVLAVFAGAALRPARTQRALPDHGTRVASYLFLALLGAVTYFVIKG